MVKIRVESSNEEISLKFAVKLLPVIEKICNVPPLPVALAAPSGLFCSSSIKRLANQRKVKFSNIDSWSWKNAGAKVQSLAKGGTKLLLISEGMWEWKSKSGDIGEELASFEDELRYAGIIVIAVESYGKNRADRKEEFPRIEDWKEISIEEIVRLMFGNYQDGSLVLPINNLPIFILDPGTKLKDIGKAPIRCFIGGLQDRGYDIITAKHGLVKYPFLFWCGEKRGLIPLKVAFNGLELGGVKSQF